MVSLIEAVKPYMYHYGYWAVFFGVFLESLGLPLPGETLIIVAGLFAAKGILNIAWIVVLAVMATFVANNTSYAAGYFGGRRLVSKYGRFVFIDEKRLLALESFMQQYGAKVVIVARFILGMRQFNGFLAGMARMPFMKFVVFNMSGALLWVVFWTALAYFCGKKFNSIFLQYYFLAGMLILIVFIFIAYRFSRNPDNLSPQNRPVV